MPPGPGCHSCRTPGQRWGRTRPAVQASRLLRCAVRGYARTAACGRDCPPLRGSWLSARRRSAPQPRCRSLFAADCLGMGPHDAAVDHQVFIVAVLSQSGEHLLRDAVRRPAGKAPVHALVSFTTRRSLQWSSGRNTLSTASTSARLLVVVRLGGTGFARQHVEDARACCMTEFVAAEPWM